MTPRIPDGPRPRRMRLGALLALAGTALLAPLGGCATAGRREAIALSPAAWKAEVLSRGVDPALAPDPMAASDALRAAAREIAGPGTTKEQLERIQSTLLDKDRWAFEYDVSGSFTAEEAFAARRGNCVSFTNLFIAMGRSVGIPLRAALAVRRGSSEKEGDLVLLYGHLLAVLPGGARALVYDFYATSEGPFGAVRPVDDMAVAAIRASNRGVAALRAGDLAGARRELQAAVLLGPRLGAVHANLGLVLSRSGDDAGALAEYHRGLEAEPGNVALLHNLAAYWVEKGRPAEARAALSAAAVGMASPFLLVVKGDLLLSSGDVKGALASYRSARRAGPDLAAPLVGIARAERARGRPDRAAKALEKAARLEPENGEVRSLLDELRGGPSR